MDETQAATETDTLAEAWAGLARLAREKRPDGSAPDSIRPLFAAHPDRFARFSHRAGDLLLDISKTAISESVLDALLDLARAADVEKRRDAMATGQPINVTERRAVLHMALRAPRDAVFKTGSEDATAEVHATLARMRDFTRAVHDGTLRGGTGERFTDVVNIGIGGSDLGPAMVTRALHGASSPMRAHYLGNVDAHAWDAMRHGLDPARTLVLVASKTFTTLETMTNAALVRDWVRAAVGEDKAGQHFAALSTNLKATAAFGIPEERVFGFRDWVGGRYSLWSSIGLSTALAIGWEGFSELLAGARRMDEHFLTAPLDRNLPVLLALTGIWNRDLLNYPTLCVLPYDERLARFAAHLQQLEMESLGKRVTLDGAPAQQQTGPVVFGEPGTNAQHSFMQLVHQGTTPVPVDFVLIANADHEFPDSHRKLLANGLAQSEALMRGRSADEVEKEMLASGTAAAEVKRLVPHRVFPGNRPSNTILLPRLTPDTLGQLVALYEHKVFVQGAVWGINAFDQWGVELGKQLAGAILPELVHGPKPDAHDSSTTGLLGEILQLQGRDAQPSRA